MFLSDNSFALKKRKICHFNMKTERKKQLCQQMALEKQRNQNKNCPNSNISILNEKRGPFLVPFKKLWNIKTRPWEIPSLTFLWILWRHKFTEDPTAFSEKQKSGEKLWDGVRTYVKMFWGMTYKILLQFSCFDGNSSFLEEIWRFWKLWEKSASFPGPLR